MKGLVWKGVACTLLLFAGIASAATSAPYAVTKAVAKAAPKTAAKAAAKPQCITARGKSPIKIESRCLQLEYTGQKRTYRLYKPKVLPKSPMSLLLVLHGGGGSGSSMEGLTLAQFNRIADKRGFIAVYPDGVERSWNDGRSEPRAQASNAEVNDVEFLRTLALHIAAQYPINRKRIYATGISNGGLMAMRLACDAADLFAAVAPVAANLSVALARDCQPTRMISIAMMSGTEDPMMPWLGGDIKALGTHLGEVLSTQESFEHWTEFGDCAIPTTHMQRDQVREDGTSLVRHVARECRNNSEMRLYEILGGGHTWPGGHQYLSQRLVGKVSRELNASEEIWSFVSRFSLP